MESGEAEMEIQRRSEADLEVFVMSGRLTILDGADPLRLQFKQALDEGRLHFVFDLRELRFIDSASIGEMIACLRQASDQSGSVRLLVSEGGTIDKVIRLSGVDKVFEVFYDAAAALQR